MKRYLILTLIPLAMAVFTAVAICAETPSHLDEPVLTWNLFLTAFLVPLSISLLYYGIRRLFAQRDQEQSEKDTQIKKLLAEREAEKEEAIREWRTRLADTQCAIKKKVDTIAEDMHKKVDWTYCEAKEKKIEERLRELGG